MVGWLAGWMDGWKAGTEGITKLHGAGRGSPRVFSFLREWSGMNSDVETKNDAADFGQFRRRVVFLEGVVSC